MKNPSKAILIMIGASVIVGLGVWAVPIKTYESSFSDSLRADFDLGTGRVEHEQIDELLRTRRIGFVDGTMWSGAANGADYTDLRIDLNSVNSKDLIDELIRKGMIGGNPTWFVNDVKIETANQMQATGVPPTPDP